MHNTNPKTNTPYGVIRLDSLDPNIADILFYEGENLTEMGAYADLMEEVTREVEDEWVGSDIDDMQNEIERRVEERCHFDIDESVIEGVCDKISYRIDWLGGAALVWVFESPLTGRYAACSPCVPGGGDLDSPDPDGTLCYDVPLHWRASNAH